MFLGWTGFAIPIEDVADRLSVIITLLLTSTAFKYVITEKLPRIDYPTQLDYPHPSRACSYCCFKVFSTSLPSCFSLLREESSWLANTGNMRGS